jgi:hypothetical protein
MYLKNGSSADDVGYDPTPMVKGGYGADNAALIVDKAEAFIQKQVAAKQNFLATIWFQNVHVEYTATEAFTGMYPIDPENATHAGVPDQEHQDYYGCVSAMDAQVGRVRQLLVGLGVSRDTFLFFTADNGPEVNTPGHTFGLAGRKRSLTEGGIRMPSLMEWPAMITRNHNSSWPGVSNDLMPTILEIFGVKSRTGWVLDGVSLLPMIVAAEAGSPPPKRMQGIGHATMLPGDAWDALNGRAGPPSFDSSYIVKQTGVVGARPPDQCSNPECSNPDEGDSPIQQQLAWTDNDHKLWVHLENRTMRGAPQAWPAQICRSVQHGIGPRDGCDYVYRLYDIESDPYETKELSAEQPALLKSMTADLMAWYSSVLDSTAASGMHAENKCRAKGWKPPAMPPPATNAGRTPGALKLDDAADAPPRGHHPAALPSELPPDPVGEYDFPDPAAVFDGKLFHAYGGSMTMSSPDLRRWGPRPGYLAHAPAWAARGARGGAPSPAVRLDSGEWAIYYQANPRDCEGGPPCGCIGSAKAATAVEPFVPTLEPVICMPEERGLVDGSARRLSLGGGGGGESSLSTVLYFKSTGFNTLARPARLWGVALNAAGTRAAAAPVNLLNQTANWEASHGIGCIEAPALYSPRDGSGRHFLFYSGGDWTAGLGGLPYSIGYASCAGQLGPCTKRTQARPWFGPAYNDTVGVGGQEVFTDGSGRDWMIFHGPSAHDPPLHSCMTSWQPYLAPLENVKVLTMLNIDWCAMVSQVGRRERRATITAAAARCVSTRSTSSRGSPARFSEEPPRPKEGGSFGCFSRSCKIVHEPTILYHSSQLSLLYQPGL